MRFPPRGGGFGVRALPGLSCAAGVCSNRGGVVIIVAVLHHKVVASLRLDQTHPTAHKDCGFLLSNSSYKNLRDGVETY